MIERFKNVGIGFWSGVLFMLAMWRLKEGVYVNMTISLLFCVGAFAWAMTRGKEYE